MSQSLTDTEALESGLSSTGSFREKERQNKAQVSGCSAAACAVGRLIVMAGEVPPTEQSKLCSLPFFTEKVKLKFARKDALDLI